MATVLISPNWTLTAQSIIKGALELCGVVGAGDTVTPEDNEICLRAFNGILKELPLHGLAWPKLTSAAVPLAWASGFPDSVLAPDDYFGVPTLKYTDAAGVLQPLAQLSRPAYEALQAGTGTYPQSFYVAPDRTIYLWPTPTQDPQLRLKYQAVVQDVSLAEAPDIDLAYINAMQYWVASEVSLKFGVARDVRIEIAERLAAKRLLMMQWATDLAPICFEVAAR